MYYTYFICNQQTDIKFDLEIFKERLNYIEQILKHGRLRILPPSLFLWLHPYPNWFFVVEKTINKYISYFGFLVDKKEIWKIFDVKRWQNWYVKLDIFWQLTGVSRWLFLWKSKKKNDDQLTGVSPRVVCQDSLLKKSWNQQNW